MLAWNHPWNYCIVGRNKSFFAISQSVGTGRTESWRTLSNQWTVTEWLHSSSGSLGWGWYRLLHTEAKQIHTHTLQKWVIRAINTVGHYNRTNNLFLKSHTLKSRLISGLEHYQVTFKTCFRIEKGKNEENYWMVKLRLRLTKISASGCFIWSGEEEQDWINICFLPGLVKMVVFYYFFFYHSLSFFSYFFPFGGLK